MTQATATDALLIADAAAGNRDALGELLMRHQDRLYNIALRMTSSPEDAADVVQEAVVRIIENADSFRGDARVTTWMTRIVMNQAISLLRKRKVRRAASLESAGKAGSGQNNDHDDQATSLRRQLQDHREPAPGHRVENDEQLALLHRALAELDEDHRSIIVLRDIDDMDYQSIADTLELAVGTVKSRLFRGRLALRQVMTRLQEGGTTFEAQA